MSNIIASSSIEVIQETDQLSSKVLIRKFGQENDSVELTILDLNDDVVLVDENFTEFHPAGVIDGDGLYNSVNIDFANALRKYGINSGIYKMKFSFQRKLIKNTFEDLFYIDTISPSKQELVVASNVLSDEELDKGINDIIVSLNSAYIKDINLNFGNGIYTLVINSAVDGFESPHKGLFRLYEPLPLSVSEGSPFRIIEEIINPIELIVDLGVEETIEEKTDLVELRGPNLNVDFRLNTSVSSGYKCYNEILQEGAISSSFNNLQNYLSQSIPVDLDFDQIDLESGYTFGNFIHFSSATERLKNFKYKIGLIESYENGIRQLNTITGSTSQSVAVVNEKDSLDNNINGVVQGFDYYERYLYFESGTYAWPKRNTNKPYIQYSVSSSQVLDWYGSETPGNPYYGGQIYSASYYDDCNIHLLRDTLPQHILDSPDNDMYLTFVDMVGQHFDGIWVYINSITDIPQADSKISDGISKELVFNALKQTGISAFDQFENTNLFEYLIGDDKEGNFQYQPPISQSMVRATDSGSLTKGDITKEVWKRLYHNAPYLLKTKGTERGIKALIAAYGIPETVLHVKEYGGPTVNKADYRTFSYQKYSKALHVDSETPPSNRPINLNDMAPGDNTFQLRANVINDGTYGNDGLQRIMGIGELYEVRLSQSIQPSLINSGNFSHLVLYSGSTKLSSSSLFPAYDGNFWNYSLVFNSASISSSITAYATKASDNQNIWLNSCSYNTLSSGDVTGILNSSFNGGSSTIEYIAGIGFKGYLQEVRAYNEELTTKTIATQSLSPFNYNGNSVSSSYDKMYLRIPLGSDLVTSSYIGLSPSFNSAPNTEFHTLYSGAITFPPHAGSEKFSSSIETHHLTTPDTVGASMVSSKVRIDSGSVYDDILSPVISVETSPQDRQPNDYSDIGVFFSPTFEYNEDIVYTLGPFRLDDYIGDPTHFTASSYPNLDTLKNLYHRKVNKRYDFSDYIKTIQYFDHTIFKIIEQFLPAKANVKTGLLIEPHYLERTKFPGNPLSHEEVSIHELDYIPTGNLSSVYETPIEPYYNILDTFDGSFTDPFENNATTSRRSSIYYNVVRPYNQLTAGVVQPGLSQDYPTDFTVGVNPEDGGNDSPLSK